MRHIADTLDATLALERLAAIAAFSPYHLHQIYRALTGETIADTVRRLRMHRAAGALVRTRDPLAKVARRAGYGSVPAFARAFREFHGIPPAAYRRRGRLTLTDASATPEDTCTRPRSATSRSCASPPSAIAVRTWRSARLSSGSAPGRPRAA